MAKTGHLVGYDPVIERVVVLRLGQDGKAVRQVDVLTEVEAVRLASLLNLASAGIGGSVPEIHALPEPQQVALFDLELKESNS